MWCHLGANAEARLQSRVFIASEVRRKKKS